MCNKIKDLMRFALLVLTMVCASSAASMNGILYDSNRLASSLVKKVCQDKYGFIWVASDFGLSKFDGYRFVNYYHSGRDTTSITDNLITTFATTRDGRLFIGCSKGLMSYDHSTDRFVTYRFPGGATPRVNSMRETASGDLQVFTAGHGMYVLGKADGRLAHSEVFESVVKNCYECILHEEADGHLWLRNNEDRVIRCKMKGDRPYGIQVIGNRGMVPVALCNDDDGNILVFYANSIQKYDVSKRRLVPSGLSLPKGIGIIFALKAHDGTIYLTTYGKSIYIIRKGETTAMEEPAYDNHNLLQGLTFNSIFQDKDNNLWLTCPRHGLYLKSQAKQMFKSWKFTYHGVHVGDGIYSIQPLGDDEILCTVNNLGLFRVNSQGMATKCESAPSNSNYIFRDREGTFWLGTWTSLYTYDRATGACTLYDDLGGRGTTYIASDGKGRVLCNVSGDGFMVIDKRTGKTKHYNTKNTPKDSGSKFGNNWVGQMYCDHEGVMWITTASGVWQYDPEADRFLDTPDGDGLMREKSVTSICETKSRDMIIGTTNGLYVYRRKDKTVEKLPGGEPLEDMKISSLTASADGNVWIATVRGIWQYDCATRKLISHVGSAGIVDEEFNQACAVLGDTVFLGSNCNVVYFHPSDVKAGVKKLGEVFLTRFATISKSYDPSATEFTVTWDDNRFTMEFSLLNYHDAANIDYEYRMNGGCWIPCDNDGNTLTFTRLKPGTYELEIRASSHGEYSSATRCITIKVEAPWYASALAKAVYAMLGLAAIYFVVMYFHRRQQAAFDEEKMQFLINATHDIRSPLTMILGPIDKLKEFVHKTCDDNARKTIDHYVDIIDRNADRLLLLVNQILDVRKIDKNQMRLKCRETEMVGFVKRVCRSFEFTAEQRGIDLVVNSNGEQVTAWIDRGNFDKVMVNLLSNSFKFTLDGGSIAIELGSDGRAVWIKVIDDGAGFAKEDTERLFDRFYQGNNTAGKETVGTGIGLNLAMNIVRLHGGSIKASNRDDGQRGACITIELPLGNAHLKPEYLYVEKEKENAAKKVIYQKYRVMIVDDDSDLAAYVANELKPWYFTDVCSNGIEAMAALLAQDYDLVVSDVVMPGMDGIELLKKVKQNPKINHIPVILLSTKSEADDRLAGFKSGADAYIAKPFSTDELHARIESLINNMLRLRGKFTGAQQQKDKVEDVEVKSYDDELMKRVMKSINAHMDDSYFSVDVLSQEVGMSRVQLHRKMKELTGVPVGKFIRNIRMEQAERLLREGKANVTQIAYSVGFSDQTYFSTVFKQYYGKTPSEYAKK